LLAEAAAWRLLGLLFERPRERWWQEVADLRREVEDPDIGAAADAAREEADEGTYLAVLGPGGAVSPREVAYRGMEDPGHLLADIEAFYAAFAFHPQTEEAPDHLAVEAGFLAYLSFKEAYARARANEEDAEIVAQAAARFREAHLSAFAEPVRDRLEQGGIRYLLLAAAALARRAGPPQDAKCAEAATLLPPCDACPLECDQG
jgi:nitrate reductase assembly molybdenum cofactor insertion protein NarJ